MSIWFFAPRYTAASLLARLTPFNSMSFEGRAVTVMLKPVLEPGPLLWKPNEILPSSAVEV